MARYKRVRGWCWSVVLVGGVDVVLAVSQRFIRFFLMT
jgi:hypothetical protein